MFPWGAYYELDIQIDDGPTEKLFGVVAVAKDDGTTSFHTSLGRDVAPKLFAAGKHPTRQVSVKLDVAKNPVMYDANNAASAFEQFGRACNLS